jgi:signal transduction histidine kinase
MADASHELRTPVSVIQGESEVSISQTDRPADDYRESLAVVNDEARRLARIVDELFLLARADAGQVPLRPARFYLDETVGEVARALRTHAASRGVRLTVETLGESSYFGDEGLVRSLVMNLLENALRFTPEGEAVRVRLQRHEGSFALEVENPGPPIPAEAQQRVFERFFRADSTRARAGNGAGLGLSISRWIAEAHGGALRLERSDERGTMFVATLPSN